MESVPPLDLLQRWLQAVITHPGGAAAGIASSAAQQHCPLPPEAVSELVSPSCRLSSVDRLEIYARAYFARLLEVLHADFPRFARAVGDDQFTAFAVDYLQQYPSRSYTLGRLGANFPQFLAETRPQVTADEPDWPLALVELATLEWAIGDVFDGPGPEGDPPGEFRLEGLSPERFAQGRLRTSPALRLLEFRFPINDWWERLRQGETPPPPAGKRSWLALMRVDYVVRRVELSRAEYLVLEQLASGQSIGTAIATLLEQEVIPPESLETSLGEWFARWRRGQLVVAFELPPHPAPPKHADA